jgi:hypothetical protein
MSGRHANILIVGTIVMMVSPILAAPSSAQAGHVEQFQSIAIACLGSVPDGMASFVLNGSDRMPFVRTGLIGHWLADGRTVYDTKQNSDSGGASTLPELEYDIEQAGVEYDNVGSGRSRRSVSLALRYELTGPDDQVLSNNSCNRTVADTLDTDMAALLKDARFPETDVTPDNRSWLKKALQPAVVIGAAALGTALFFNLRSERADDG